MKPAIERIGVTASALLGELHARCVDRPWSAGDFADLLDMPGSLALVAGTPDPVGFILLRQVADEAEVILIAVEPAARRQGVARCLLQEGTSALDGVAELFLEVATDNAAAIALYERAGFAPVGLRRGYYTGADGTRTDALIMRKAPALPCREPD